VCVLFASGNTRWISSDATLVLSCTLSDIMAVFSLVSLADMQLAKTAQQQGGQEDTLTLENDDREKSGEDQKL